MLLALFDEIARHCLLGWMKPLIGRSVPTEFPKMVLFFSSGKTTTQYMSCQIFMGKSSGLLTEPKRIALRRNFHVLCLLSSAIISWMELTKLMLRAVQGLGYKSKKRWHRIFCRILDRTAVNLQIVHSKLLGNPISVLEY